MNSTDTQSVENNVSEDEYLRRQAEVAKAHIGQALHQAKVALGEKVNPGVIVGKHPIIAILSATVAGFVAAAVAIPSKEEQELRRLAKLHRVLHPEPKAAPADAKESATHGPAKSTLWATVLHELIALLKPILLTAITAGIRAGAEQPHDEAMYAPENSAANIPPIRPDNAL